MAVISHFLCCPCMLGNSADCDIPKGNSRSADRLSLSCTPFCHIFPSHEMNLVAFKLWAIWPLLEHYLSSQPDLNNHTMVVMPFLSMTSLLQKRWDKVPAVTVPFCHPCSAAWTQLSKFIPFGFVATMINCLCAEWSNSLTYSPRDVKLNWCIVMCLKIYMWLFCHIFSWLKINEERKRSIVCWRAE